MLSSPGSSALHTELKLHFPEVLNHFLVLHWSGFSMEAKIDADTLFYENTQSKMLLSCNLRTAVISRNTITNFSRWMRWIYDRDVPLQIQLHWIFRYTWKEGADIWQGFFFLSNDKFWWRQPMANGSTKKGQVACFCSNFENHLICIDPSHATKSTDPTGAYQHISCRHIGYCGSWGGSLKKQES